MLAALALPRLLKRANDRNVMILGAGLLTLTLAGLGVALPGIGNPALWSVLLVGWLAMGVAYSVCVTPGGRLLKRSSDEADRPALFAAQFALSHVCWRSEEHTSELQSLMRSSYAVFWLKKTNNKHTDIIT